MPRIDLPENYAVRFARQSVNDSLMSHGEECVVLHTYHVNTDEDIQPRCPECYDDLYQAGQKNDCGTCYGTTFLGGIKDAYRVWGIFTDAKDEEDYGKRGVWHPVARNLHTEYYPDLWQHDFVVRVTHWSADHRPQNIEGIYVFDSVQNESLRTGNRPGNISLDNIGQRADLQRLAEQMPIHRYPILGVVFDRAETVPVGAAVVGYEAPFREPTPPVTGPPRPPSSPFLVLTRAEYDALPSPDPDVVYVIED